MGFRTEIRRVSGYQKRISSCRNTLRNYQITLSVVSKLKVNIDQTNSQVLELESIIRSIKCNKKILNFIHKEKYIIKAWSRDLFGWLTAPSKYMLVVYDWKVLQIWVNLLIFFTHHFSSFFDSLIRYEHMTFFFPVVISKSCVKMWNRLLIDFWCKVSRHECSSSVTNSTHLSGIKLTFLILKISLTCNDTFSNRVKFLLIMGKN